MSEPVVAHARGRPRRRAQHLVAVTKADARSPVHRRAWLDLIAVSLPPDGGGRPGSTASSGCSPPRRTRAACVDVPLVRRRVAEVIARSGVPVDSHTGKELLDVLETYPRDELLQVGADELLPVALAVLHLQERRQTRLFLRQDPTGRFWSALVYLPARPVHDRGAAGDAAAAARAAGRHEHRVHGAVHRVGARPAALRRPRAGGQARARRSRWTSTSRRCRPSSPPPPAAGPTTSPTRCTPGTAPRPSGCSPGSPTPSRPPTRRTSPPSRPSTTWPGSTG